MQDGKLRGAALAADPEGASIRRYLECMQDRALAQATAAQLDAAQSRHGLVVGGRPLCTVLRPRFMAGERAALLGDVARTLASLFERAGRLLLADDDLLDLVGASEEERAIWEVDPGYDGFTLTSRLDSFMVGERPRFVEYNAESPAGIGFCDLLVEVFNDLPAVREWRAQSGRLIPLQPADGRQCLFDTLLWAYRARGGSGMPVIAVIDWADVITRRDFELCCDYFRSRGATTIITDPRRLEFRSGRLWCGDAEITLVYRRVLLHELLEKAGEAEQLLRAYREGAICMVNSPRSKLLHKKTVLALLSDERLDLSMTAEERAIVDSTIPWTRIVASGETTYDDRSTDLPGLLAAHPERFALKPSDDYGGRGVVLGWDTSTDQWTSSIETALAGGYVAQERVDVPTEQYPVRRGDDVEVIDLLVDANPLLFRGEMGCVLTRLSGSALLNVTAGTGSAAPTFVLQQEG